jgi:kinesin family protein 5
MSASKTNLQVREDTRLGIIIPDATEVFVGSVSELHEIRMKGAENRALGVTLMNAQSSRSHGVLRLRITKRLMSSGERRESRLHFVDLAGSEKVGKTQAQGQQLNEAKNINRSLTNLGLVITALAEGKFVPYRNSKLTRMLQESLGGNSLTTLILACSPSRFNDQETLSTLLFGQRAKKIKNTVKANVERSVRELEEMLKTAERKASDYEELLKKISSRSLDFISGSPLNQNTNRFKFQLGNLADKSQTIERGEPTKVSIALQTDPEHPPKHPASRPGSPAKKVLDSADELALLSNMTPEEEEAYLAKLEAETLVKLEEEERVYQESVRQVEEAKQRRREKYKEVETQTESGEAVFTNPEYITKAMELIEVQTELSRVQADNKLTMERVVSLNDELHSLKQELKKSQEDYSKLRDKNHSLAEDMKQDLEILASKLTESNIKQKSFAHEIDALILSNTFITTNLLLSSESKFREEQNTCLTELSEKLSRLKLDASSNCAYSECCSQLQGLLLRLNIYLNQQNQSTRDDNTEQNMDSLFLVKSPRNLDLTSLPSPSPIFLPNDDQSSVSLDLTLDLPKQDQLAQAKTITILHNQINSLKRKIEELTAQHKRQQREQKTAAVKVNNQVRQRLETELQAWKSQLKDVQREKELLELGLSSEKQKSHDFSMQIENIKR